MAPAAVALSPEEKLKMDVARLGWGPLGWGEQFSACGILLISADPRRGFRE